MTPMERTEHHFGPFREKDFRPLCFTADKGPLVFGMALQTVLGDPQVSLIP